MIAGHLQIKRGYYHMVLTYKDEFGKKTSKWRTTGLKERGNKKRAEAMLLKARMEFDAPRLLQGADIAFTDFLLNWLHIVKPSIRRSTFASYSTIVKKSIVPYFREQEVTIRNLTHEHLQDFYTDSLERVKASTVLKYHANIHKALKYAVKTDLISSNAADKVEQPKAERFIASFLDSGECEKLYIAVKKTNLEFAVMMGIVYGLRRSEIVGLKWKAIDFYSNSITINHIVTTVHWMVYLLTLWRITRKTSPVTERFPLYRK